MREIKFRAWCNIENKMYQKFYVEDHLKFAFMDELISSVQERYTLMQYTGLKDKNGVEIYEGDLLEGHDPESRELIRPIMGVYWSSRGMWDCESFILGGMNETCEVVGNIYENPELISH